MRFGAAAFFGWLAATGMAVLLTALVAGAGTALGLGLGRNVNTTTPSADDVQSIGIVGVVVLLVIVFIAYLYGGFVAARMSRFSGVKQGVAVWLWAVIIAIIVAVISAVAAPPRPSGRGDGPQSSAGRAAGSRCRHAAVDVQRFPDDGNTYAGASSAGWPARPNGVCSPNFGSFFFGCPPAVCKGSRRAWRDHVDPDALGRQLLG